MYKIIFLTVLVLSIASTASAARKRAQKTQSLGAQQSQNLFQQMQSGQNGLPQIQGLQNGLPQFQGTLNGLPEMQNGNINLDSLDLEGLQQQFQQQIDQGQQQYQQFIQQQQQVFQEKMTCLNDGVSVIQGQFQDLLTCAEQAGADEQKAQQCLQILQNAEATAQAIEAQCLSTGT